jgi:hypothetical protein
MSKRINILFKSSDLAFQVLHVIAWVIFVGLCIEAGALIVNFIFSLFKPEFVGNLYQKLDLSKMYQENKWAFFGMYSFVIFLSLMKAILFYVLIELLHKLDLKNPFSSFAAKKISVIADYTLSIGILSYISRLVSGNFLHNDHEIDKLSQFWVDSQAFILMAAIVYVIAQIFKRGVELQNENDLTV